MSVHAKFSKRAGLLETTDKIEIAKYKAERDTTANHNCSTFFIQSYARFVNGIGQGNPYGEVFEIPGRKSRFFRPDVVRDFQEGGVYTEVKATAFRRAHFMCGKNQLENYSLKFLNRIMNGHDSSFEYAFFRYGVKEDYGLYACAGDKKKKCKKEVCDHGCLVKKLAKTTRSLRIIPANLVFYLAYLSRPKPMDHSSTNGLANPEYFTITEGMLGLLEDPLSKIQDEGVLFGLHKRKFKEVTPEIIELLALDKVKKRENVFPEFVVNGGKLKKFPVFEYYLEKDDYVRWLEIFKKNHRKILEDVVGIDDLYETIENVRDEEWKEENLDLSWIRQCAREGGFSELPFNLLAKVYGYSGKFELEEIPF